MNAEDYVSYQLAIALKEAGFDLPCFFYFTKEDAPDDCVWLTTSGEAPIDYNRSIYAGCSMPTLAQAQKWLREKGILVWVHPEYQLPDEIYPDLELTGEWWWEIDAKVRERSGGTYPTYEAALSAGIEEAIKLIKE